MSKKVEVNYKKGIATIKCLSCGNMEKRKINLGEFNKKDFVEYNCPKCEKKFWISVRLFIENKKR